MDKINVKDGFAFVVLKPLTSKVSQDSIWLCFSVEKANESISHDKDKAWFVKLNGMKLPRKVNDANSINFYPESIKRYIELGYIEEFKIG